MRKGEAVLRTVGVSFLEGVFCVADDKIFVMHHARCVIDDAVFVIDDVRSVFHDVFCAIDDALFVIDDAIFVIDDVNYVINDVICDNLSQKDGFWAFDSPPLFFLPVGTGDGDGTESSIFHFRPASP